MNPQLSDYLRQGDEFRVLLEQVQKRDVVHAMLVTGERGVGKRTLARLIGTALLCHAEGRRPCGICKNCQMAAAGEHPDLIIIEKGNPISPDVRKDRTTIPVDDIREMIRLCSVRSFEGNMHVVLIFDADKMTPQAQNCLLKTLEEPPEDTVLILVTERIDALLSTVVSRCRMIRLKPWEDDIVGQILKKQNVSDARIPEAVQASGGSIGRAVEIAADESYWKLRDEVLRDFFGTTNRSEVLRISNGWKDRKGDGELILQMLESFVRTLLSVRMMNGDPALLSAFPDQWKRFSGEAAPERFIVLFDAIAEARKQIQFFTNFQAVIEKLLFIMIGEGNTWLK